MVKTELNMCFLFFFFRPTLWLKNVENTGVERSVFQPTGCFNHRVTAILGQLPRAVKEAEQVLDELPSIPSLSLLGPTVDPVG